MTHRFTSGRIEVRVDGATMLEERLKGKGTKIRFVRTLQVPPGSHRVEVRVTSGKSFDGIEGIQGEFRPKEQKNLSVSLSPISRRLRMRFEEPEPAGRADDRRPVAPGGRRAGACRAFRRCCLCGRRFARQGPGAAGGPPTLPAGPTAPH